MRSVRTNQEAACTGGKLFRQINEILNKATSILYFCCRLYIGPHSRALSRPTCPCKYGPYCIVVFHSFDTRTSFLCESVVFLMSRTGHKIYYLIYARDKANSMVATLPDANPKATVPPQTAMQSGRCSGGSQRTGEVRHLTHWPLRKIEGGGCGRRAALPSRRGREMGKDPLSVWREVPSSEKESELTLLPVLSVCCSAPDPASHSLTVPSRDADASVLPSGEKATE